MGKAVTKLQMYVKLLLPTGFEEVLGTLTAFVPLKVSPKQLLN